ncbi:MAG: hypothetical protein AB3K77_16635 [Methanosarcinaceae archaeon]|uniref:hypothetical protein n=1 Tax=Methanosarcina sp. Mfa9 TaxID=3439063 RepID=UPI00064EF429
MSVNDIAGESSGRAAQSRNHTVCRFRRLYAPVPFAKSQSLSSGHPAWPIGKVPEARKDDLNGSEVFSEICGF